MKKIIILLFVILSTISLFSETILTIGYRHKTLLDKMPSNNVRDTRAIKQDTRTFASQVKPMSRWKQLSYDKKYNEKFFKPWSWKKMHLSWRQKKWQFFFARQKTYFRYGKPIPKKWFSYQKRNSNFKAYESILKPAITLRHCDLKVYPSRQDFYYNPKRTGEGFPFDYNQNSSININTPLLVSHYSRDKKWVYIRCAYAYGWLSTKDIAFVDKPFMKRFKNNNYYVTVKDNLFLKDKWFKSIVKLGTIFPMDKKTKKYMIAKKRSNGYALISLVKSTKKWIIVKKPFAFNGKNVTYIANQLLKEPYGWGGKLEARDCSSLTKDFFAPFGIFLRRNSAEQSHDGKRISIRRLPPYKKKRVILKNAKPFRSLLYVRGHITLYVGERKGEPMMIHNYWGARLNNRKKIVFGRAVLTSTEIGKERKDIKKKAMLINTFSKIVNF